MKITRQQLRRIIKEAIDQQGNVSSDHNPPSDRFSDERFQDDYEDTYTSHSGEDLHGFLLDFVWPCYQEGDDARDCIKQLTPEQLDFLRGRQEEAVMINDNPDFIAFCMKVMDMIS